MNPPPPACGSSDRGRRCREGASPRAGKTCAARSRKPFYSAKIERAALWGEGAEYHCNVEVVLLQGGDVFFFSLVWLGLVEIMGCRGTRDNVIRWREDW